MSSPDIQIYGGFWYVFPFAVLLFLAVLLLASFAGWRLYNWVKDREGYKWLANNTEDNAMVLTWWNHADGVEEVSHRNTMITEVPVANFFILENEAEAIEIARKYNVDYVLVAYPSDVYNFKAITLAAEKNPDDYIPSTFTIEEIERRSVVKKETVGIKMIYGEEIEGFEKVFDNKRMRIYKFPNFPVEGFRDTLPAF